MQKSASGLLLFDGICNLCNRLVVFVIRHDANKRIRLASLQSEPAIAYLKANNISPEKVNSVIYFENSECYLKSGAILHLIRNLDGGLRFLYGFIIVPRFIRDFIYDLIAGSRYRVFGRSDSCLIPSPEIADRFL